MALHVWLVQVAQRKMQSTKNRNVLFKGQSQYKMNNKTNKQRKEEQSLGIISSSTQILNSESH